MSDNVDDIIGQYLAKNRAAQGEFYDSPLYHAQVHWLRGALGAVEKAMEQEDIPEATRIRVLKAVVFPARGASLMVQSWEGGA